MTFTVPIPIPTTSLRHAALALIAAAALVGCGSTKPVPAWQTQTLNTTDAAVTAFLQGQAKVADLLMKQAQFSASSTGRLEAVYKLTLLACALRSASLSVEPCPRPEDVGLLSRAFEDDEWATLAAYRRYLIGERLTPEVIALLPDAQRGMARLMTSEGADGVMSALLAIQDPLSRLVASGVWLRHASKGAAPSVVAGVVALAIDTASREGWRRPLAAWLTHQMQVARAANDLDTAARAQARLSLVLDGVGQK